MIVYVLQSKLLSNQQINDMYDVLPDKRKQTIDKIKVPVKKSESTVCSWLALGAIHKGITSGGFKILNSDDLPFSHSDVQNVATKIGWQTSEQGKPFANGVRGLSGESLSSKSFSNQHVNNNAIYVSISHSDGFCAVAASSYDIGLDIQDTLSLSVESMLKISKKFTESEHENILKASKRGQECLKKLFFTYWTSKESVFKLCGQGMKTGFNSFEIIINKHKTTSCCKLNNRNILINHCSYENLVISVARWKV